jgi:tRNA-uridine 2-sulfurtransferase
MVGLSGGVDSSVAALRLLKQGYDVTGVFIKVWHPEWLNCNWEEERLDAMRVAAHLDIPFLTCDAEDAYRTEVGEYFINEYRAGRTPNPDIMCNQHVKFGAFLRFAEAMDYDYVATGHYARRIDTEAGPKLHRGLDPDKDQSYFLWTLSNDQLGRSLFPVGDTIKAGVRAEARTAGIPVAQKKDSQGICFLGHIDIKDFLSHYTDLKSGPVKDQRGKTIGVHDGALIYTLGQRHGFTINENAGNRQPYYVTGKDIDSNTLTVSHNKPVLEAGNSLKLQSINIRSQLKEGDILEAQIRYRQKPFLIQIVSSSSETLNLQVIDNSERPDQGQSCVLYRNTECLGGGIIC